MKIIYVLFLLIVSCSNFDIKIEKGIYVDKKEIPPKILEIKNKWKEYKPAHIGNRFEEVPSVVAPYKAGELAETFLIDGMNMTKFVRYLAGVSENVELSGALCEQAQHGAVLLAKTGFLTHKPGRPKDMKDDFYKIGYKSTSSSNIHQSIGAKGSLAEAVKSFCDDSDESNIDAVGHRRWVLNPQLKELGFGYATKRNGENEEAFVTMQVFDMSNTEVYNKPYLAWPSPDFFPLNVFGPTQAWSVSLNGDYYDLKKSNPKVRLTRLNDNRIWDFSNINKDKSGKYFNIEKSGYGLSYCIIFRPDQVIELLFKKDFKVLITGLFDTHGKETLIEYEVSFFNLL